MKIEIRVLTQDGALYTKPGGGTGQLPPNVIQVLEDPVSVTISAPAGEVPGQGETAPLQ